MRRKLLRAKEKDGAPTLAEWNQLIAILPRLGSLVCDRPSLLWNDRHVSPLMLKDQNRMMGPNVILRLLCAPLLK